MSTMFDAMIALDAALKARPLFRSSGVRVGVGFPPGGPQPDGEVWIPAEVDDLTRVYNVSGDFESFDETYGLRVYITVEVGGDGRFDEVLPTIRDLHAEVVRAVTVDPTLGGAVQLAVPARSNIAESYWTDSQSRTLDAVVFVDVQATTPCD